MSDPTSHRPEHRRDPRRHAGATWDASRPPRPPAADPPPPPDAPPEPHEAGRLAPFQSEAPHRRTARPGGHAPTARSITTVTADGAERILPPSGPLALSPRTVRHTPPPRRRRWWRAAATTGALVMLPFLPVSDHDGDEQSSRAESPDDDGGRDTAFDAGVASLEASRIAYSEQDARRREDVPVERDGVAWFEDLHLASISPDTAVVGFHEAYHGAGLPVTPAGPVQANHNPGRSTVEPDADATTEPMALILPTRERGTDAHSAIDVAIPVGSEVRSPVDGTVVGVAEYQLYGKHPDTRIEIRPDDRPDIVVVMLHVTGARVEVGDPVAAGRTVVADSPNALPFASQIDRFAAEVVGQALPHVHLELMRAA